MGTLSLAPIRLIGPFQGNLLKYVKNLLRGYISVLLTFRGLKTKAGAFNLAPSMNLSLLAFPAGKRIGLAVKAITAQG